MYYVTMTDKFMSGWGQAKGLINKLVFECETYREACTVFRNAKAREDMKHVNMAGNRPSYYRSTKGKDYKVGKYYVQNKTKEDYSNWYVNGYSSK